MSCASQAERSLWQTRCYTDPSREISYFCTKPSPASGVGEGVGDGVGKGVRHNVGEGLGDGIGDRVKVRVGDGSEREELMVSVTLTVTAAPTDGVITTFAGYVPAARPATFALKVSGVTCPTRHYLLWERQLTMFVKECLPSTSMYFRLNSER
jgi:hypothetical protein